MIKVLIVDDEFYSRKGIVKLVPWENLGCKVCGEADNAYDAIEKAILEKPDIVITDINMPEINGLEMAKTIKDKNQNTKFIIITGYDDFNYARGAIKINAVDFLLKPIDIEELNDALEKCTKSIIKDNDAIMFAKEKKLIGILRGEEKISEIDNFFNKEDKLAIALINNDDFEKNYENKCIEINYFIKEWIKNNLIEYYNIYQVHTYRTAILLKEDKADGFEKLIYDVQKEFQCNLTISITKMKSVKEIRELYKEAKKLLEESFYIGKGKVIKECDNRNSLRYSKIYIKEISNDLIELIVNGETLEARKSYDKIFNYFIDNKVEKNTIVSFVLETITKLKNKLKELQIPLSDINEVDDIIGSISVDNLKEKFIENINILINNFRDYKGNLEENSMDRAIAYIKSNYHTNISLKDVSEKVYLNTSYLSRAIKHNLGMSFTEYIRKLRIEKSIELLKKGNTILSISKEIGYCDYRQFTLNFKKYTGYTPSSYNIEKHNVT